MTTQSLNLNDNLLPLPQVMVPIIGNNVGNAPSLRKGFADAADAVQKKALQVFYKRTICMTTECVACPYARENGSC